MQQLRQQSSTFGGSVKEARLAANMAKQGTENSATSGKVFSFLLRSIVRKTVWAEKRKLIKKKWNSECFFCTIQSWATLFDLEGSKCKFFLFFPHFNFFFVDLTVTKQHVCDRLECLKYVFHLPFFLSSYLFAFRPSPPWSYLEWVNPVCQRWPCWVMAKSLVVSRRKCCAPFSHRLPPTSNMSVVLRQ